VTVDDGALLRAVAAGDADAFTRFVHAHEAVVRRYLRVTLGTRDVDDAAQETFINAWRGAAGYRGGATARGWLYAIARHVVHHLVRRRVDEPAVVESLEALAEQAGWGRLDSEVARTIDAGAADADARSARDELAQALARLPADEREVLVLRELDGYSGEEAAAMLHLTLPAMKSRLHRARLHLAALVRQQRTTAGAMARDLDPSQTTRHSGGTHGGAAHA